MTALLARHGANEQVTTGLSFLAAILAWASFGIAYQLTPKVQNMLRKYNAEGIHNGFTLDTIRGNATWILLVGAVRLRLDVWPHADLFQIMATLAVPLILVRQAMVKKEAQTTHWNRKQSTDDDHPMVMA